MSKVKHIGIIAEDISDFESSKILIKRITNRQNLSFKKAIGNGCGRIRRKANDYSIDLCKRGCNLLILLHDLDRNDLNKLHTELTNILSNSPIINRIVCIPVEEIEAWFLSDPAGIKKSFNLKRKPKITGNPETIPSPKEKLGGYIHSCSEKNTIYLNTKHNQILSQNISLDLVKMKCQSFGLFYDFINKQKF